MVFWNELSMNFRIVKVVVQFHRISDELFAIGSVSTKSLGSRWEPQLTSLEVLKIHNN